MCVDMDGWVGGWMGGLIGMGIDVIRFNDPIGGQLERDSQRRRRGPSTLCLWDLPNLVPVGPT